MAEDTKELVCIICPLGCRMTVSGLAGGVEYIKVEGNGCKRGPEYAIREATAPTRTIPSTVAIRGAFLTRLPVKTAKPVPKQDIMRCMKELRGVVVHAPIHIGTVVMEDIGGTGVSVVATRSMPALE